MQNTLVRLAQTLNEANIPYQFVGPSALLLQGVQVSDSNRAFLLIQWDLLETTHSLLQAYSPTEISKTATTGHFSFKIKGITIHTECRFNTTVRTDPYRTSIHKEGIEIWVSSLYSSIYDKELKNTYGESISQFLMAQQELMTKQNQQAWNQAQYNALIDRYGEPDILSEKIKQNPEWRLHPFFRYMGDVHNKKVTHLLGSNGIKGVSLALLGANVTVVDFSKENAMFATELANAAKVELEFISSDVFSAMESMKENEADIVLMELGVLHYFIHLEALFKIVHQLLKPGGRYILHEFHPISTKLITSTGKKHKVTGNYFNPELEELNVAFSKHMSEEEQKNLVKVRQRKWTIGEIITILGQVGLMVKVLEEEPNHKIHDIGLPKTFTLVAEKI